MDGGEVVKRDELGDWVTGSPTGEEKVSYVLCFEEKLLSFLKT